MNSARVIQNDPQAVKFNQDQLSNDLRWCLLSAAVHSYRSESLVRPFPPEFMRDDGVKDFDTLRKEISSLPSFGKASSQDAELSSSQEDLLSWSVDTKRKLKFLDLSELDQMRQKTAEQVSIPDPDYFVEVEYNDISEEAFQQRRQGKELILAYHGSRAENFHSIVNHGLHSHLNKTSVYGEGTYLSTEPSVAMGFSPWGSTGWNNSIIGNSMSVIALCEVIEHPSVKISTSADPSGRRAPNSEGGNIPDKYIVVTNDDMVRVKYLLVYAKHTAPPQPALSNSGAPQRRQVLTFIQQNSNWLLVIFYCLFLAMVGLFGSQKFWIKVRQTYEELLEDWELWPAGASQT